MAAPNKEDMFNLAKEAISNGQKQPARMMLQQILENDHHETRAMMWMAKIARSAEEREKWLERVIKIDPDNKAATKALKKMHTSDASQRNKLLLRIGSAAYVVVILVLAVVAIALFA